MPTFHFLMLLSLTPYFWASDQQLSPSFMRCHFLHLQMAPGCVGVGCGVLHSVGGLTGLAGLLLVPSSECGQMMLTLAARR